MHFRPFVIVSSLLLGAACAPTGPSQDEVWKTIEACGGKELCAFATLATAEFNKRAGRSRQGVSIRGAQTDGRIVKLALNVPNRIKDEPQRGGKTIEEQLTDSVRRDLCGTKNTRRFFELGGELEFSTVLPSGELFSKSRIKAC